MEKITNVYDTGDLKNKINEVVDNLKDAEWQGGIISEDIIPDTASTISLGAADKKFKAIYADEVHISQNTLYIGDTPVIGTESETINIKADEDQSVLIKTTGLGQTQLSSENGISLTTRGTTANININADGTNAAATMNATKRIDLTAPQINITGTTTVTDLVVTGTTTTTNSANLTVSDNMIEVNSGETGVGVSKGTAGVKVDRGDALPYLFVFDEADDMFKVGEQGNLEIIASQDYVDSKVAEAAGDITIINTDVQNSISELSASGKTITYIKNDGTTGSITTQDTVPTDYITNISASGKTVTFIKKDGTTGTFITQDTTDPSLTTTASTQATLVPKVSASGKTMNLSVPNVTGGIAAGTYSMKNIIQQLINNSHTHKLIDMSITSTASYSGPSNSCDTSSCH